MSEENTLSAIGFDDFFETSLFRHRVQMYKEFSPETLPFYVASIPIIALLALTIAILTTRQFIIWKNGEAITRPDGFFLQGLSYGFLICVVSAFVLLSPIIKDSVQVGGVEGALLMPFWPFLSAGIGMLVGGSLGILGCFIKYWFFQWYSK